MSGRIEFGRGLPDLRGATLHVWIEDTTYADAPAVRVSERQLIDVADERGQDAIPFALEWDDDRSRSPGHTYSIAAFVDLDRDGRPGPGDYICYEAVPVPPPGNLARVRMQRIA